MKVLLSIKPKYADLIFLGKKHYEFRKVIFRVRSIEKVVVYASNPISKVIGEFKIEDIISSEISDLWEQTMEYAGVDKDFYDEYFSGRDIGHAIKVKNPKKYEKHKELQDFNIKQAPQSFVYID